MHAILTNPALNDIVAWAPHGRSWTILKPRAFEVRILPKYFEHSKFSSFVRQANGWGFRRLSSSEGNERNTYYHEYFLRGMPWLVKKMRRPKVNEKKSIPPEQEPGFAAISDEFPVPDRPRSREILVLQRVMEKGAKARMPVCWELESPVVAAAAAANMPSNLNLGAVVLGNEQVEGGGVVAAAAEEGEGDGNLKPPALPSSSANAAAATVSMPPHHPQLQQLQQLVAMQQMNRAAAASLPSPPPPSMNHGGDDSGFAAGFMAATAYHNRQVQSMLGNAFMFGMPVPSSPSLNRIEGLDGNNNYAAMMGAAAAAAAVAHRQNTSDFALARQMHMQASMEANRPNVSNDLAMAQQFQFQAYHDFLNGYNNMPR
jgi:hypothetical protein